MNLYYVHDNTGRLIGSIETVSESDAAQLAHELYKQNVLITTSPERDWYMRRELPVEQQALNFDS